VQPSPTAASKTFVTLGLNCYFDPNTKLIFTTALLSAASPPQRASRIQHRPGHLPNETTGRFLTLVPSTAEWAIRMRPRNGSSNVRRPTTIGKMCRTQFSPEPWGPWSTIYYDDHWSVQNGKDCRTYHHRFPGKWISADGKTMWLLYSGLVWTATCILSV